MPSQILPRRGGSPSANKIAGTLPAGTDLRFSLLFGHTMHLLFMKCTVCIDSETDECQVISAGVAGFVHCVLFVPAEQCWLYRNNMKAISGIIS